MATNTQIGGTSSVPAAGNGPTITGVPKAFRRSVAQLTEGIQAGLPDGSSLPVAGQTIAKGDLVTALERITALYQAIDASVAATTTLRQQLRNELPSLHRQVVGIKDALVAHLGRGMPQLAHFGIKASMGSNPLTPEQKVVRAEKALKTRALRHTMGKRQKAAIQYAGELKVTVDEPEPTNGPGPASTDQ